MDPLTTLVSAMAALGLGATGAAAAVIMGRDGGGRDIARLRHMAPQGGFKPTEDGRWKHDGLARSVYLVIDDDGSYQLVARCAGPARLELRSGGKGQAATGDEAFDARFEVRGVSFFTDLWRCLSGGSRGALVRLAMQGDVVVAGDQVIVLMEHVPSTAADLVRLASEAAVAADGLGLREWDEVADEEPPEVLSALLRELIGKDDGAAQRVARRVRAKGLHGLDLATEVARALRDGSALMELLPAQHDAQAVFRIADRLEDEALAEALALAAAQGAAVMMTGCAKAALERADRPPVQRAALDALEAWLAPGALKMPFVEQASVELLLAGGGAIGPDDQPLLERMLKAPSEASRVEVLRVAGRRGTTALVPALRALQERTRGTVEKAHVAQTIARVQARASGDVGALSLPSTDGGGLAVVPED